MYSALMVLPKITLNAINKAYVAEMVARESGKVHSPWSDAAGFYVSHYADFAGLWRLKKPSAMDGMENSLRWWNMLDPLKA